MFTKEFIARARQIIAEGTLSVKEMKTGDHIDVQLNMLRRRAKTEHCEYYYPEALDEIESLQAKVEQRSRELQYANKIATEKHHKVQRLQARVEELEQELKKNVEFYFDGEKNE